MKGNNAFFQDCFKGKINSPDENLKSIIQNNPSQYEAEIIKLAQDTFQEWSENLLHLTKTNLYETVVIYFSIFTSIIDDIPSYFPENSQIFLSIVQLFLSNIIQNEELMLNIYNSICFELRQFINNQEKSETCMTSLNTLLSIFKSFHVLNNFYIILKEYKFDFSTNLSNFPIKESLKYLSEASRRYLKTIELLTIIFSFDTQKEHQKEIDQISNVIFNQLITSKLFKFTSGLRPPIGELLTTPLVSWIYETLLNEKNDNNQFIFDIISLYEGCANYIYDLILMFSIDTVDQIGAIIKTVEILSSEYCNVFSQTSGAITYLETSIITALNDDRMKFSYNFAAFLDRTIENAFLNKESVWKTLLLDINSSNDCGFELNVKDHEFYAKSVFLKYVNRIENKKDLIKFVSGSINNLITTYNMEIIETINPLLELFQLALGLKLTLQPNTNEGEQTPIPNLSLNSHECHSNHCHCLHRKPEDIQVEASLTFQQNEISVFTDLLTVKVIKHIIQTGPGTPDQIALGLNANAKDVENRLITLSSSILYMNDDGFYGFNQSYQPTGKFLRFPPFFESHFGSLENYKLDVIKNKVKLAIKTKGSAALDVLMFDSYLILKSKLKPDTAMIQNAILELKDENIISENNGIVTFIE